MKIYVITSGCYSDYCIEKIFTNKYKAEEYVQIASKSNDYLNSVSEWETSDFDSIQEYQYVDITLKRYLNGNEIDFDFEINIGNTLDNPNIDNTKYYYNNGIEWITITRKIDIKCDPDFVYDNSTDYDEYEKEMYKNEFSLINKYRKVCRDILTEIKSLRENEGWTDKMIYNKYNG
jgi:hypothetical protein